MEPIPTPARLLSFAAFALAASASAVTIAWDGAFPAFPDEGFNAVLAEGRGWSAVTLLFAVPVGFAGMVAAGAGSLRGRLAWVGTLAYLVYAYLEIAVSPPFSALYLAYVATLATAGVALVSILGTLSPSELAGRLGPAAPRRAVATFCFVFSVGLAASWLRGIVVATASGAFGWPLGVDAVGHVVHALDLGLVVPLGLATGAALLTRRAVAAVLAPLTLVFAAEMSAALVAMVGTGAWMAGQSAVVTAPFVVLWLVGVGLAIAWFRAIEGHAAPRGRVVPMPG